ncbi:MAG TPA: hypothetical protein VGC45_04790 [Gryllotalpicola sp.]
MRFDQLFDDLEAQLEHQLAEREARRRTDAERLRIARLTLRDRLAALVAGGEGTVRLRLADGAVVELAPAAVGRDWLAADLPDGGQCVVPLGAVAAVSLSAAQARASSERMPDAGPAEAGPANAGSVNSSPAGGGLTAKIGIGVVLRDLARRRVPVDVCTRLESAPVHGTIDRVGADHLELAVHERGVPRRASSVVELRVLALAAITRVVL